MKTFKKILSIVLAMIMIVGALPFVYKFDNSLAAIEDAPKEDSLENGFVQGENDLVILMQTGTEYPLRGYASAMGAAFKGSKINVDGVDSAVAGKIFDRLIFVFVKATQISLTNTFKTQVKLDGWAKTENVIWTSKCTITKPEYVYNLTSPDGSTVAVTKCVDITAGPVNYYDSTDSENAQINIFHRAASVADLEKARILMGCNLHWDYITVNTVNTKTNYSGYWPVIDANGCNLKIGKYVDFKYYSGQYRKYLITNSAFRDGQTIEILGGDYSGIAPFPVTDAGSDKTLSGTLNVKLDGITINAQNVFSNYLTRPYVFANADMAETAVINYEINSVTYSNFTDSLCVFGGRKFTDADTYSAGAAPVAAGTVNLTIRNTELPYGIGDSATNSDAYLKGYKILEQGSGFSLNVALGRGTTVGADLDLEGFNNDYCATTVYVYDEEITDSIKLPEKNAYINSLSCVHVFDANGYTDESKDYHLTLSCNKCGFTREFDVDKNGHPAVYVDALTGNDNYLGDSIATAVQSMSRASQILAKWGVGGTIVVIDAHNNYQYMAEGNDTERIYSAGGPITITSSTTDFLVGEKIDFREKTNACWVPYTNIRTTEDIILEDLILVPRNTGTRSIYLSGCDFIVKESCEFRAPVTSIDGKDVNLYVKGTRMQYLETDPTFLALALITGYNPSAAKAEDVGTQNIVLESGVYKLLVFGNRSSALGEETTALTGNVNVYVGKGVVLNTIDAAPEVSQLNPTFVFENGVDYEIATELPTTAKVNIKAKADVVNALADHIVIANSENLTFVQNSVKWENNQASARVENVVSADWMEANVAELGFFIKEYDHAPFAAYFADADLENDKVNAKDGVGKSLAYDKVGNVNQYFWDGAPEEDVTFRGVLEFDKEEGENISYGDTRFIAVPYALLNNGEFINGTPVVFTLREICDAIVILCDESATEEEKAKAKEILGDITPSVDDKDKAESILAAIPEFKYPDIHENGTDEEPYVITPVYEALIGRFDPTAITAELTDSQKTGGKVTLEGALGIPSFFGYVSVPTGGTKKDLSVTLEGTGADKVLRLGKASEYTFASLTLNLDPVLFAEGGCYDFSVIFKLSEGYGCTDSKGRAVIARTTDINGGIADHTILTGDQLLTGDYSSEWTTVDFTLKPNVSPKQIEIIIFANPGDYIDIKSVEIRGTLPVDVQIEIPGEGGGNVTPDPDDTELPTPVVPDADAIKIVCMGDSLTAGTGIPDKYKQYFSYPAQLQQLLGSGYNVLNCGKPSATALPKSSAYFNSNGYHYGTAEAYSNAKEFAPDIMVLMLGTNDVAGFLRVTNNAPTEENIAAFQADYKAALKGYVDTMKGINPDVKIFLMLSPPYESNATRNNYFTTLIHPVMRELVDEEKWGVIDLYSAIKAENDQGQYHYTDGVHFDKDGYAIFAKTVYDAVVAIPKVVYVSNNGNGDGKTAENPTKLANALSSLKVSGGTVVITDAVTPATSANNKLSLPSASSPITITSYHDGVDYAEQGASLTLPGSVIFNGDYTLEKINLVAGANDIYLAMQFNNVTIGDDVNCSKASGVTTDMYILAGYYVNTSAYRNLYEVSCNEDAEIVVKSGTWAYFNPGNRRTETNSTFGTIQSGVSLVCKIEGGTYTAASGNHLVSANGMNNVEDGANVYVEISGGTFNGPVNVISRRGSAQAGVDTHINGNVTLKITGGTFNGATLNIKQGATPAIGENADIKLVIAGGEFSDGTTSTGTNNSNSSVVVAEALANTITRNSYTSDVVDTAAANSVSAPELLYAKQEFTAPPVYETKPELGVRPENFTAVDTLTEKGKERLEYAINLLNKADAELSTRHQLRQLDDTNYNLKSVSSAKLITLLTGEYSINKTLTNYSIGAAGGGYMVDCGEYVLFAFGDTEDEGASTDPNYVPVPWRSNTLAFTKDIDFSDGIIFEGFYMNDESCLPYGNNYAEEFLLSEHKDNVEKTRIPTGGVMIDGTLYYYYMSVNHWSDDGTDIWVCNYGGLAKSTDFGRTWEMPTDLQWPGTIGKTYPYQGKDAQGNAITAEHTLFGLGQLYPVYDEESGYVYVFGVPGGRKGAVKLMRVKAENIENFNEYEYLVSRDANGKGVFEKGEAAMMTEYAAINAPAGGPTLMYNEYLDEWVITYCAPGNGVQLAYDNAHEVNGIYMRVAKSLDDVWSDPVLIMSQASYGQVYEPRVLTKYQNENKFMLICTTWDIYQSLVFEVEITKK